MEFFIRGIISMHFFPWNYSVEFFHGIFSVEFFPWNFFQWNFSMDFCSNGIFFLGFFPLIFFHGFFLMEYFFHFFLCNFFHEIFPMEFFSVDFFSAQFFLWNFYQWNFFHGFFSNGIFFIGFFFCATFSMEFFQWIFFSMEIFHDISGKCNSKFYKKIEKFFHWIKIKIILWKILFFYGRWISVVSWKFHRFWRSRWIGSQSSFYNYNRLAFCFCFPDSQESFQGGNVLTHLVHLCYQFRFSFNFWQKAAKDMESNFLCTPNINVSQDCLIWLQLSGLDTVSEKSLKMSHLNFLFFAISNNFCPNKNVKIRLGYLT